MFPFFLSFFLPPFVPQAPASLDELDDDMVADLVATYNFGGGEVPGSDGDGGAGDGAHKTRKQVCVFGGGGGRGITFEVQETLR